MEEALRVSLSVDSVSWICRMKNLNLKIIKFCLLRTVQYIAVGKTYHVSL